MPQSKSPSTRNHTARIGRLVEAVDAIYQQRSNLTAIVRQLVRDVERDPITKARQLIAEYELETGETTHPLLMQAIEYLGDRYNGLIDTIDQHSVPIEAMEVIVEERTWWNVSHKRNEYMAAAQARRRAKTAGQRDISADDLAAYNERSAQHPPADPKPWTDEELASGVWRRATDRDEEKKRHEEDASQTTVERQNDDDQPQTREQYEERRAIRQQQEADLLANPRPGGPLVGRIKP